MTVSVAADVVVVSHRRPRDLTECLQAIVPERPAGIVVVADSDAAAEIRALDLPLRLQVLTFDQCNIAAARNLGIAACTAPVIAFIDDDARPAPGWLAALAAPFADPQVVAATGPVRTGGGPRWQFRGERIDRLARIVPLDLPAGSPVLLPPPADGAILTIGTNCAFRADSLREAGGFDPVYRYYLDEADLNMRLAAPKRLTAYMPPAEVFHHRAAGPYRRADGSICDHTEIGASLWMFLHRFAPMGKIQPAFEAAAEEQIRRILRAMIRGDAEPADVSRARRQLRDGNDLALKRLSIE